MSISRSATELIPSDKIRQLDTGEKAM